jgi:hypothetical protein
MSFRTILKDKTNEVIDRIKTTAINEFILFLKTHMNHTASFGKNKGIINLEENHCAEYDDLEEWMKTLCRADRIEAESLQRLVVLEAFEELMEESEYPEANKVIDQFRLTK